MLQGLYIRTDSWLGLKGIDTTVSCHPGCCLFRPFPSVFFNVTSEPRHGNVARTINTSSIHENSLDYANLYVQVCSNPKNWGHIYFIGHITLRLTNQSVDSWSWACSIPGLAVGEAALMPQRWRPHADRDIWSDSLAKSCSSAVTSGRCQVLPSYTEDKLTYHC